MHVQFAGFGFYSLREIVEGPHPISTQFQRTRNVDCYRNCPGVDNNPYFVLYYHTNITEDCDVNSEWYSLLNQENRT